MIKNAGPMCIANGYPIVAVTKGKKCPTYKGWQTNPLTVEDVSKFDDTHGVGILTGVGEDPIYALDFDVDDEALAEELKASITRTLGVSSLMYRVGKAPKFLVPVLGDVEGATKSASAFYEKDGKQARLEILGRGQQFVAYHIHPNTGKPYTWFNGSPSEMPAFLLPVVSTKAFNDFVQEFSRFVEAKGYTVSGNSKPLTSHNASSDERELIDALTPTTPPLNITLEQVREVLNTIELDLGPGTHDAWVRLGMALHHQTNGSAEGLAIWDEVSSRFPEAYDPTACAKRWATFKSDKSGGMTFRYYYKQYLNIINGDATELSAMGLYLRALQELEGRALFLYEAGDWVFFDGAKWVLGPGEAYVYDEVLRSVFERRLNEEIEAAKATGDEERAEAIVKFRFAQRAKIASVLSNIVTLLRKTPLLNVSFSEFDMNHRYFGVANGVLDLETGHLLGNTPELRVLRQAGYNYDPSAKCPHFEQALNEWMDGNTDKVKFLQRLIGQALTGERLDSVFLLARGGGCNGKSVFMNTISKLFGGYSEVVGEETLLGFSNSEGGRARADLAKLHGARFVYCSETSENRTLREADVKRMTSRESFSARRPFGQKEQEIIPTWLLCVGTNYPPKIRGDDDGVWRRVADVEFPRNFETDPTVKLDNRLTDKLLAELPGILNWALEGLRMYRQIGLAIPAVVTNSTAEYRDESNLVLAWKEDCLTPKEGNFMGVQELYDHFLSWVKAQGETSDFTKSMFSRRLKRLIQAHRRQHSRGFIGYTFKGKEEQQEDFDFL